MNSTSTIKTGGLGLLLILLLFNLVNCKQNNAAEHAGKKERISFKPVFDVNYIEVARRLDNGLSFNEDGYQLEPSWQIKFVSDDSVSIYSPAKKASINFPVARGTDSIFYAAKVFFKVKKITRDSMLLQLIEAKEDSIDLRGARLYMTFYAEKFIKNVIRKDTAVLKAPTWRDTVFVKKLIDAAEKDYSKAFFARRPAVVSSKSSSVKVETHHVTGNIFETKPTDNDYMYPTFNISIKHAKEDFYYSFSVTVDSQGGLHYEKSMIPGNNTYYISHSKAVLDNYLKRYLNVKPGSTLGMLHPSTIYFHVKGEKGA
ncbi:hypothetical protein D0C36_10065 [Mucilaginibacter conchicola]|uniref:Uncharacterized protein n=1 Tax=Mucilaginibacter conchicola TaxID=2303333 RepID=A0A372NR94_9SPHI|nr:hypothetical protein [Mucilaginibacter conchicola]RFZ91790.1 hypothetical protein D0C36_10065 [Mucilaginibacter conchicola]